MLRPHALPVAVVFLCASGIASADVSATQTPSPTEAARQAELTELVELGNRARLAGRNREAAALYKSALEIQRHPVIAGRLGLVLVKLGQLDRAAEELHEAVVRGQGVAASERQEVAAAYDKAKLATTWVNVDITHAGAKVTYDGAPRNPGGFSHFWMFALPGEHTLRASLEGYHDAVATFTAKPGEEIVVKLEFVSLYPQLPKPEMPVKPGPEPNKRTEPPMLPSSNFVGDPDYSTKEDPSYEPPKLDKPQEKQGPRISVSAGIVTVFGVASWNPAVGPVVGVGLRPKEFISFGLEGRAAWLTTGVGGGQISATTVGGILSACGHVRWFFGCGLGYVGRMDVKFSAQSYKEKTVSFVEPGFGGRLGANVSVASSIVVRPSIDVLGLPSGTKLVAGEKVVADQPAVMISGQITGGWEF